MILSVAVAMPGFTMPVFVIVSVPFLFLLVLVPMLARAHHNGRRGRKEKGRDQNGRGRRKRGARHAGAACNGAQQEQ